MLPDSDHNYPRREYLKLFLNDYLVICVGFEHLDPDPNPGEEKKCGFIQNPCWEKCFFVLCSQQVNSELRFLKWKCHEIFLAFFLFH